MDVVGLAIASLNSAIKYGRFCPAQSLSRRDVTVGAPEPRNGTKGIQLSDGTSLPVCVSFSNLVYRGKR